MKMSHSAMALSIFYVFILVALFALMTLATDSGCAEVCFRLQNLPYFGKKEEEQPFIPLKGACNLMFQATNAECPLKTVYLKEAVTALKQKGQLQLAKMLERFDHTSRTKRGYSGQYCRNSFQSSHLPGQLPYPPPVYQPSVHHQPQIQQPYPSYQEQDLTCDEAYSQLLSLKTTFNYEQATVNQQRTAVCIAVDTAVSMLISCDRMLWHLQLVSGYLKRKSLDSLVEIITAYKEPSKLRRLCR